MAEAVALDGNEGHFCSGFPLPPSPAMYFVRPADECCIAPLRPGPEKPG